MKGKAPRKHSLHGNIAASVLLKLFISGNEKWHTTDAPLAHEQNSIFKCKQDTIHDSWGPEKYNFTMMKYGATFYSRRCRAPVVLKKCKYVYIVHVNNSSIVYSNETHTTTALAIIISSVRRQSECSSGKTHLQQRDGLHVLNTNAFTCITINCVTFHVIIFIMTFITYNWAFGWIFCITNVRNWTENHIHADALPFKLAGLTWYTYEREQMVIIWMVKGESSSLSCQILVTSPFEIWQEKQETVYNF